MAVDLMKQSRQQLPLLWLCRQTLKWCSSIQHSDALPQKKEKKKRKRHNFHIQSSTPTQLMTAGLEWKRNDIIHTSTHKEGSGSSRMERLNALLHDGINRWQRGQAIARLFIPRPSSHGYSIKTHTVLFHSQELGDNVEPNLCPTHCSCSFYGSLSQSCEEKKKEIWQRCNQAQMYPRLSVCPGSAEAVHCTPQSALAFKFSTRCSTFMIAAIRYPQQKKSKGVAA